MGWLVNIHETLVDDGVSEGRSGIDLYFLQEDGIILKFNQGSSFKATIIYEPYFFVLCQDNSELQVQDYLKRRFQKTLVSIQIVEKEDLQLSNHLLGKKRKAIKLVFHNGEHLKSCKQLLSTIVEANKKTKSSSEFDIIFESDLCGKRAKPGREVIDHIIDLREHDVMYYTRVTIDQGFPSY